MTSFVTHRPDDGAPAQPDELMDAGQAADDDVVLDDDMAGQSGLVGHDDAISDLRVVSHVRAGHEEAVVADARDASASLGAGVHGDTLADPASLTDDEPRVLSPVLEVLGNLADRRKREYRRSIADLGVAGDDRVALDHDVVAEPDLPAYHREGTDAAAGSNLGAVLDHRRGVDRRRGMNSGAGHDFG